MYAPNLQSKERICYKTIKKYNRHARHGARSAKCPVLPPSRTKNLQPRAKRATYININLLRFIMDITWHGYSCFTIKTKGATVVVDPYKNDFGLKLGDLKADLLINTGNSPELYSPENVKGEPEVIDWPGEYEIKGVAFTVLKPEAEDGVVFTLIDENNLKLCFIDKMSTALGEEMIESIGDVDVLLMAVGGNRTTDAQKAHKIIEEIEPRCVIPMNYAVEGATEKLDPLDNFLKLVGANAMEPQDKYSLSSRSSLKEDTTEYVILNPQS